MTLRRKKKTSLKERIRNQPSFALFYYVPEILILCMKGKIYLSQIKIMSAILFDLKQQVFIESRTVKRQTDDRERPRGGCEVISSSPLQPHGGTTADHRRTLSYTSYERTHWMLSPDTDW